MTLRRLLLATGLAALVASAAHPTDAAPGRVELDADGYGGTSTGGWICGPVSRAHYAGGAAELRYREPVRDDGATTVVADVAASVERESQELLSCGGTYTSCDSATVPPPKTLIAARARLGIDYGPVAVEAGPLVAQWWAAADDGAPATRVRPDVDVRIGRAEGVRGHVGFGAPVIAHLRRPGAYLGVGFEREGWAFDLYPSLSRSGPSGDDLVWRLDGAVTAPIGRSFGLRAGATAGYREEARLDAAGSAGLAMKF